MHNIHFVVLVYSVDLDIIFLNKRCKERMINQYNNNNELEKHPFIMMMMMMMKMMMMMMMMIMMMMMMIKR